MVDQVDIVNIARLIAMDEDNHFDNVNVSKASFTPMHWALPDLHETMAEITTKCKADANIELSFLWEVTSNIH